MKIKIIKSQWGKMGKKAELKPNSPIVPNSPIADNRNGIESFIKDLSLRLGQSKINLNKEVEDYIVYQFNDQTFLDKDQLGFLASAPSYNIRHIMLGTLDGKMSLLVFKK
jgi:hypothetical protein